MLLSSSGEYEKIKDTKQILNAFITGLCEEDRFLAFVKKDDNFYVHGEADIVVKASLTLRIGNKMVKRHCATLQALCFLQFLNFW